MVADQEVDPRRDGGMKLMTFRDLLHGRIMPKTDCHGKKHADRVLHVTSGSIMTQYVG